MSARAATGCHCGGQRTLVIVYALPAVICETCHEMTGPGATALEVLPFNGALFTREPGVCGYLSALWAWLSGVDQ